MWAPQAGATLAGDLCPGLPNPCVIAGNHTIDDPSLLDFRDRDVILEGKLDVGPGSLEILAGSLTIGTAGQIRADIKQGNGLTGDVLVA